MKLPRDFSFVFFGLTRFDALPQRDRWIAAEIAARGYRVMYIEPMPSAASALRTILRKTVSPASNDVIGGHIPLPPSIKILRPPLIPTFFTSSFTPSVDRRIFRRWFSKTFREFQWSKSIIFLSYPYWWPDFVDRSSAPARLFVYDRCDSLAVPSRTHSVRWMLEELDGELLKSADVVTFSALGLRPSRGSVGRRTELIEIPNAVSREYLRNGSLMKPLKHERPVVGMCGAFDRRWVDDDLMVQVVERFPNVTFSIVGPVDGASARKLRRFTHVRLHGPVPFPMLPSILSQWDVAIIPFRENEITDSLNPLKLYEYLGAGLPVVATSTRELRRYSSLVELAAGTNGFVRGIENALKDGSRSRRNMRKQFARRNTWTDRVDTLLHALEAKLARLSA